MESFIKYKFFALFTVPILTIFLIVFLVITISGSIISKPEIFIANYFAIPFDEDINYTITSKYGKRIDPITGLESFHLGIDIGLAEGTEILSSYDGIVYKKGYSEDGLGEYIKIKHIIETEQYLTVYGHLKRNSIIVKEGDTVNKNDIVALSGNTGKSTGPHLHFEVHLLNKDGTLNQKLDPINIFESN